MPYAAIDVTPMSRLFKVLGDDIRLRIVALLAHGELCVCHIEEALELSQPNASRHLGLLRDAGVVSCQRRDRWAYYRLADQPDPRRARHLELLVADFADEAVLKRDVKRLVKARGPGRCA